MSHVKHERRRYVMDILQGEIKKINPPMFDKENKKGEYVES
jgi:hypothetical protein